MRRNKLQHDYEDIEEKVERVDPEFVSNLRRGIGMNNIDYEQNTMDVSSPGNDTDTRLSPRSAIDETRSQLRTYMMAEQDLKEFENREEWRELMESETDEEEYKNVNFGGKGHASEKG